MRRLSAKGLVVIAITVFWAVMMSLLARREWASVPRGPDALDAAIAPLPRFPRSMQMGIYSAGSRVGGAKMDFLPQPNGTALFHTRVEFVKNSTAGIPVLADLWVTLDRDRRLSRFNATFKTGDLTLALRGTVLGDQMEVVYSLGGQTSRQRIPFQGDAFFSSSLAPLVGNMGLERGEKRSLALWNPLTRRVERAWIENKGVIRARFRGRWVDVNLLRLTYGGMQLSSWVTSDGEVLRQETPFGFVLEKE